MNISASLLIAKLDLNIVRLLRRAMQPRRDGCRSSTKYQDRQIIHPQPRIEPRRVLHPNPTYSPRIVDRHSKTNPQSIVIEVPVVVPQTTNRVAPPVLEAPWKKIPWQNPLPPVELIKVFATNPDEHRKGQRIDCFF